MPAAPAALRAFEPRDAAAGHALTTAFGWPHRAADWALMARLGTGVVAEAEDGTVLATALRWPFGPRHAAVGMIGVRPDAQGRGLGRLVTEAVLDAMPPDGTAVLTATEAGLPLYRTLGFVPGGTVRQLQGTVVAVPAMAGLGLGAEAGAGLRPMKAGDAAAILALDRDATGMDRAALLQALLQDAEGVIAGEGGFALLRPFGRGEVIGPVVARTPDAAAAMLRHLLHRRTGRFVRVDVPEESGLVPLLESHGLGGNWPGVRMARGAPPEPGAARVFAMASQAWG